jgi:hypothetical protein
MSKTRKKKAQSNKAIEASLQIALEQSQEFLRFLEQAEEREALKHHNSAPAPTSTTAVTKNGR